MTPRAPRRTSGTTPSIIGPHRPRHRLALVTTAVASLTLAGVSSAGVAYAQDQPTEERTIDSVKVRCLAGIDERLATLDRLMVAVDEATVLTEAHEASFDAILAATTARLEALIPQIQAASTPQELRPLCTSIASDNRVYLLVAPQVHLVIALDHVDSAAAVATEAVAQLDAAIAEVAASGGDVSEAQAHRDLAVAAVTAASAAVAGHADVVIALTPNDWNNGTAEPILDAASAGARDARSNLGTARSELAAAVVALRSSD